MSEPLGLFGSSPQPIMLLREALNLLSPQCTGYRIHGHTIITTRSSWDAFNTSDKGFTGKSCPFVFVGFGTVRSTKMVVGLRADWAALFEL